jgi:UDP-N-acetylglucosamine:LPS N-acetylglucosamine transferase
MPYASSQDRAAVSFSPSGPAQAVIERGRGVEQAGFAGRRLRICLAASGGGHLRQLLDLQKVWSAHDYLFITEDTSLGRSIAQSHPAAMVPHFALGQLRLNGLRRMIGGGLGNLVRSARIIRKFRPDVVISTGAGTVFFPVFWARLSGAEIILIESFARFNKPSLFARLSAPLSHRVLLQSEALRRFFPRAIVFDPLRVIAGPRPPKKPLVFVTVGATLPFDRLIAMVADLKAQGLIPEVVK